MKLRTKQQTTLGVAFFLGALLTFISVYIWILSYDPATMLSVFVFAAFFWGMFVAYYDVDTSAVEEKPVTRITLPDAADHEEPDIAFWFDKKDVTRYLVKARDGLPLICFNEAAFDLLVTAIHHSEAAIEGAWRK